MVCEDVTMLESNSWDDVVAFVEDGKRHFPNFPQPKGPA
jgi:hypothetical protein|tara:strand:- start:692 stop:808 length:117 start_codon:yes stop_codon:yes gene_type:complete